MKNGWLAAAALHSNGRLAHALADAWSYETISGKIILLPRILPSYNMSFGK